MAQETRAFSDHHWPRRVRKIGRIPFRPWDVAGEGRDNRPAPLRDVSFAPARQKRQACAQRLLETL